MYEEEMVFVPIAPQPYGVILPIVLGYFKVSFPTFLSYSALKLYSLNEDKSCKYAFYLRYKLRKKPTVFDNRIFFTGAVCHNCMSRWIIEKKTQPGTMRIFIEEETVKYLKRNRVVFKGMADHEKLCKRIEDYVDLIETAYHSLKFPEMKFESEVKYKVWFTDLNCFLFMRFDLVSKENCIGVDLKVTDKLAYLDRRQCVFGSLLFGRQEKREMNRPIQFIPLRKELQLVYHVDNQDREELLEKIKKAVFQMRSLVFEATPDMRKCRYCEMAEHCDKKETGVKKLNVRFVDGRKMVTW